MSFYYLSQELSDVLELSTKNRYHIEEIYEVFWTSIQSNVFGGCAISEKHAKLLSKNCYYTKKNIEVAIKQIRKHVDDEKDVVSRMRAQKDLTCVCSHKCNCSDINSYRKNKLAEYEKYEYLLKNLNVLFPISLLCNNNKRWLEESEHLIPEWKKETEKLKKRISVLEEENKQLKENFRTNVVDIIKEYVYTFLPSFLKK
jgi:hypothetical protein